MQHQCCPQQYIAQLKPTTSSSGLIGQGSLTSNESSTIIPLATQKYSANTKKDGFLRSTGQDPIIAVMGPVGVGKSTFIKIATGSDDVKIGDNLDPCTQEIQVIRCRNPLQEYDVLFVDTPGFDDRLRSDVDILQELTDWLENQYCHGIQLSGIIYLHRVTDNGILFRNLDLFQKLCGDDALSNVRMVTMNWDPPQDRKEGERIEKKLFEEYWKPFIANGAQVYRFQYSYASAWEIINSLPMEQKSIQIQKELVDQKKPLLYTTAGQTLFSTGSARYAPVGLSW